MPTNIQQFSTPAKTDFKMYSFFKSILKKGKTWSNFSNLSILKTKAFQSTQYFCLATVFSKILIVKPLSLLSIEMLVYPNLKTLRQLSHHCCANAEVVSFSFLTWLRTMGSLKISVQKSFDSFFSHVCSIWGLGKFRKCLLLKNTVIIEVRYEI